MTNSIGGAVGGVVGAVSGGTSAIASGITSAFSMPGRTHFVETEEELDALVDWDDDGSAIRDLGARHR